MRKVNVKPIDNPIAVPFSELQKYINFGRPTCEKIAKEAGAIIRIGNRKLYNVEKIRAYLNSISE